jgi:hypothetical protein
MLQVMKSSAESSVIGRSGLQPIADIALQQTTMSSRIDFAFVCAAAKNQAQSRSFGYNIYNSKTCCAQFRASPGSDPAK